MGYTSDTTIVIRNWHKAWAEFLIMHNAHAEQITHIYKEDEAPIKLSADYWHLEAQGWKWYNSYPEIGAINAWWHFCEDKEEKYQIDAIFLQVGEDDNDTTTRHIGDGYELGRIEREIYLTL